MSEFKVKMEELNPREATMFINGIAYVFNPFDLEAKVWAKYEFATDEERDGSKNLQALFKAMDVEASLKVLYYLLQDKKDFPTEKSFYQSVGKRQSNHGTLYVKLSEVFGLSELHLEEAKKEALSKKVKAAQSGNRII